MIRSFRGKTPRIAETAFVSEAAYIVGDVEIGDRSSIWPGAVLRSDVAAIKIGENSQIEDNCVVHTGTPMTIGDNVHIGHSAVIHCSRIGNSVLVGNNTTILDQAEIGDFCVIGANSLISRGMKIPDNSFVVGSPAEIKGPSTEGQLAGLERSIQIYLELTEEYKNQGL